MTEHTTDRRSMLRASILAAIGGVGAMAAAKPSVSDAHDAGLVIDVACLFDTLHLQFASPASTSLDVLADSTKHLYGASFVVEGIIFAGGSLVDDTRIDPRALPGAMGKWYARGNMIGTHELPEPHAVVTQNYMFFGEHDELIDQLTSEGFNGASNGRFPDVNYTTPRVVMGGTGRYRGARGEVAQYFIGYNATENMTGNGHNFRFTFNLGDDPT